MGARSQSLLLVLREIVHLAEKEDSEAETAVVDTTTEATNPSLKERPGYTPGFSLYKNNLDVTETSRLFQQSESYSGASSAFKPFCAALNIARSAAMQR